MINRREFLKKSAVCLSVLGCDTAGAGVELANETMKVRFGGKRPNIIFFMIDDMSHNLPRRNYTYG